MNIFLINILAVLFCLVLGYFFGSIPTAVWVGKIFFHQDPRDYGSHNAGGTNAGRLWGKKVGFIIIVIDMLKTVTPMYICWALLTYCKIDFRNDQWQALMPTTEIYYTDSALISTYAVKWPCYWLATIGCMIGHCYPIFANFKGGKAASCFMGTTICASWMLGFIPGFAYFGFLKWKKYVSLTAILTACLDVTLTWIWVILVKTNVITGSWAWFPMYGPSLNPDITYGCTITILAIGMILRHHENIKRLLNGTERKITWMK